MIAIRKNEYPSKKTVNLVIREKNMGSPLKVIPLFVLFLILLAVFVKVGVVDMMSRMNEAQAVLNATSSEISGFTEYNADYNEVKEQYNRHFSNYLNENEVMLQNRLDILTVLEEVVMNRADVVSISIRENTCHMVITNVTLNSVSDIVADLEQDPMVQYIAVATASTQEKNSDSGVPQTVQSVTADVTITLTGGNTHDE